MHGASSPGGPTVRANGRYTFGMFKKGVLAVR
jgi:hypothetical protein